MLQPRPRAAQDGVEGHFGLLSQMSKFYFFTDPKKLGTQTAADAFGPVPGASDTQFRVTSSHQATAGAPVFAICDGQICAQSDGQGTLTLILKPFFQPSFDFPRISYILYKGVDPLSLLDSTGAFVDVTKAADCDLIAEIKKNWDLPDNKNTGDPCKITPAGRV